MSTKLDIEFIVFRFAFCASIVALAPETSGADILVRFPADTRPEQVKQVSGEIERATGIKTRGVVAATEQESAQPKDPPPEATAALSKAKNAYEDLRLDKAQTLADEAETICLDNRAVNECRQLIFEARMLKGMAAGALGNKAKAAAAFRGARAVDPLNLPDPRQYPPKTISDFSKACVEGQKVDKSAVELYSNPDGASFRLNGQPVEANKVELFPARHIIEAALLGYETAHKSLEIELNKGGPDKVSFDLTALSDLDAWEDLRKGLSLAYPDLSGAGITALSRRFDLGNVILLNSAQSVEGMEALIGKPGNKKLEPLPGIGLPGEPLPAEFIDGLKNALGIAAAEQDTVPVPEEKPDELEEEEESSTIRARTDDEEDVESDPGSFKKIVTNPWFWVSIGVVAAVVTGVVVGTTLQEENN